MMWLLFEFYLSTDIDNIMIVSLVLVAIELGRNIGNQNKK